MFLSLTLVTAYPALQPVEPLKHSSINHHQGYTIAHAKKAWTQNEAGFQV